MNDCEIEDYAEYLPSILVNVSRAAERLAGHDSSTLHELRAALGAALAASIRLRAEQRLEAAGSLGPYERSVLMRASVNDADDEDGF